jgi:hypothetical protein
VNGVQVVGKGVTGHDGHDEHVVGVEVLGEQDWLVVMVNGVQLAEILVVRIVGTQVVVGFTVMLLQLWEAVTVLARQLLDIHELRRTVVVEIDSNELQIPVMVKTLWEISESAIAQSNSKIRDER